MNFKATEKKVHAYGTFRNIENMDWSNYQQDKESLQVFYFLSQINSQLAPQQS